MRIQGNKVNGKVCPNCGSGKVTTDEGYDTVFRCHECSYVGNTTDFIEIEKKGRF